MSRDRLFLLPLLAVLFVLGACQSEVKLKGEVFIVTKGRDNIEMGLVNVKAFKASSLEEHLEKRHRQSKEEVKLRAQKAASLLDSLVLAQKTLRERKTDYEEAQTEYNEAFEDYLFKLGSYEASRRASPGDRVAVTEGHRITLRDKPDRSSVRIGYMSEGDLGKVLDVEEGRINVFYKIRKGSREVGWTPFVTRFVEPEEEVISLKQRTEKALREARRLYRQAEVSADNVSNRLRKTLWQIPPYREQSYYFENMPQAVDSDETGSDGNYELTVDGGSPYYLVAQASRSVGDEEEQYYWMLKTTVEDGATKEVTLSNDNLGGVANKGYALSERTLSTVKEIWDSAVSLAKEGEEGLEWEKLIYRTAFPQDTTGAPIPDDLDVPEEKLRSDREASELPLPHQKSPPLSIEDFRER